MAIQGTVEILRNGESTGVVGEEWDSNEVPIVLRNLHGITAMNPETPQQRPTGRAPEYQWSGIDADNQPVDVYLWREIPFEETYAAMIGPELAEG